MSPPRTLALSDMAVGPRARRWIFRFAAVMVAANVLLPAGMVAYAALTGASYWDPFYEDGNPVTWLSVTQLLVIAVVAFLHRQVAELERGSSPEAGAGGRWIWVVFGLGFAFLAIDEAFEVHEALRDRFVRPHGLFDDLPFLAPGDVGLYLYFAVGLVFTLFLLRELRRHGPSAGLFVAALVLTLSVVIVDALPERVTDEWADGYFFTSIYEEVGEVWAQLLFLLSFLVLLSERLRRLSAGNGRTGSGSS